MQLLKLWSWSTRKNAKSSYVILGKHTCHDDVAICSFPKYVHKHNSLRVGASMKHMIIEFGLFVKGKEGSWVKKNYVVR